jgi:TorA maturation chaperone TorD
MENGDRPAEHSAVQQAEARASLYGFLAGLLNEAPNATLVRQLRAAGGDAFNLSPLAGPVEADVAQALSEIAQFVDATRAEREEAVQQQLAVDWTRLFRGVSPGYGPTPPYEGLFGDGTQTHLEVMLAIQRIYLENGAALDDEVHNRADYLGLELAFLSLLAEREAEAWQRGAADEAFDLGARAGAFLADHPACWAPAYLQEAQAKAQTDFYRGLLRLTQALLAEAVTIAPA